MSCWRGWSHIVWWRVGSKNTFCSFWHVQLLFFGVGLGWKNSQSTMANWPIGIHSRSYQLVRCKLPSGFMFPTASTVWVDPKFSHSKHILHARGVALMMKQLLLHIPWNEGKSGHDAHRVPIEMKPIMVSDSIGVPRLLAKWICIRVFWELWRSISNLRRWIWFFCYPMNMPLQAVFSSRVSVPCPDCRSGS